MPDEAYQKTCAHDPTPNKRWGEIECSQCGKVLAKYSFDQEREYHARLTDLEEQFLKRQAAAYRARFTK